MELADAVEAREAALQEITKLLPLPSHLQDIPSLRAEYASRQAANDVAIAATVHALVGEMRAGRGNLREVQEDLGEIRKAFQTIDLLCSECSSLLPRPDLVTLLATSRLNLDATLRDVEGIATIPEELEGVAEMMKGDTEDPFGAYEPLATLEGRSRFAFAALQANITDRKIGDSSLKEYVDVITQTRAQLEELLWRTISDSVRIAKSKPSQLVRAVRVIEMQERLDEQLRKEIEAGNVGASSNLLTEKGYMAECLARLESSVDERFATLLPEFLQESDTTSALDAATLLASQLREVHKYVDPCFPPKYNVSSIVAKRFNRHFYIMLCGFGERAADMANTDILAVVQWLAAYERQLHEMNQEETIATLSAGADGGIGLDRLISTYVARMRETMQTWSENILTADRESPPKSHDDGRLWTPAPIDFFRILGEQITVVQETATGDILTKLASAVVQAILDYQQAQRVKLHIEAPSEIPLEYLCAVINNSVRSRVLAEDAVMALLNALGSEAGSVGDEESERASEGFVEVAKEAAGVLCEAVFGDVGVKEVFSKLFEPAWLTGEVTSTIVATLQDYFSDLRAWTDADYFTSVAELALHQLLALYLTAFLKQKGPIKENTLERMEEDEAAIASAFEDYLPRKTLDGAMQPLSGLRDFASADNTESFVLSLTLMLQTASNIPFTALEKVLSLRADIKPKERAEVLEQCREVMKSTTQSNAPASAVWEKLKGLQAAPAQGAARGWFQ